jgi:regulatory protein
MVDGEERLQRALEVAHAYLNRRERSTAEIRRQLERRGISEGPAEATIALLIEQGYLDDARFARLFVSDKRELEQWGSERIRRGLLARGIERDVAERALVAGEVLSRPSPEAGQEIRTELERALALLRRRFPVPPADARQRQRALGVLLRKGYESEVALDALAAHARDE